jgi:hypothetical protein
MRSHGRLHGLAGSLPERAEAACHPDLPRRRPRSARRRLGGQLLTQDPGSLGGGSRASASLQGRGRRPRRGPGRSRRAAAQRPAERGGCPLIPSLPQERSSSPGHSATADEPDRPRFNEGELSMEPYPHHYTVEATAAASGSVELAAEGLPAIFSAPPIEFDGPAINGLRSPCSSRRSSIASSSPSAPSPGLRSWTGLDSVATRRGSSITWTA